MRDALSDPSSDACMMDEAGVLGVLVTRGGEGTGCIYC